MSDSTPPEPPSRSPHEPAGPLAGVRIVDLTTAVMGPMGTRALADMGADVIKVEAPEGDFVRDLGPKRSDGMSGFSMTLNRNKRSVVFDLKTAEGREALLDLVAASDVFVSNVRPRALARLGLTDDDLRAHRPDLVYCSATGFGSDGPYADKAAYDDVIQAASGMASMFDWVGDEPAYMPSVVADKISALHITYAVLAALYQRAVTGQGDFVEVPMAESMAAFNLVEHLSGHTFEPAEGRFSYLRLRTVHRRPRRTADGWACVLPYSDTNWRDFFRLSGRGDLADDPRFTTINARIDHVDELYAELDAIVETRTTDEWMDLCDRHSIPASPVTDLERLEDDPHFSAVNLFTEHEHPTEGRYRVVRDPIRFRSGSPGVHRHPARLGEHTAEVLAELGWDPERITMLTRER
jgi:crotonobetainyl-CoA:carnitine CoA-transferase CaiB-like acyl-CoA transferase